MMVNVHDLTDKDLPPNRRTLANLYQVEYLKILKEIQNANKGIRRLRKRNDLLLKRIKELQP